MTSDWRPLPPPPTPNKDIDKIGRPPIKGLLAQLVERRHVNPEVAGSNPALVNLPLFIKNFYNNNNTKLNENTKHEGFEEVRQVKTLIIIGKVVLQCSVTE